MPSKNEAEPPSQSPQRPTNVSASGSGVIEPNGKHGNEACEPPGPSIASRSSFMVLPCKGNPGVSRLCFAPLTPGSRLEPPGSGDCCGLPFFQFIVADPPPFVKSSGCHTPGNTCLPPVQLLSMQEFVMGFIYFQSEIPIMVRLLLFQPLAGYYLANAGNCLCDSNRFSGLTAV